MGIYVTGLSDLSNVMCLSSVRVDLALILPERVDCVRCAYWRLSLYVLGWSPLSSFFFLFGSILQLQVSHIVTFISEFKLVVQLVMPQMRLSIFGIGVHFIELPC